MKMNKEAQWSWRAGELSLKEYYNLSSTDRKEYVASILELEQSQRSSSDNIILAYSKTKEKQSKFFEL
jgi:hypothetical protein